MRGAVVPGPATLRSPRVFIVARGTRGGGATRDEADGGETARPCLADATDRPDAVADVEAGAPGTFAARPVAAAAESFTSPALEAFATELAGTFPFTKRCSLASYTIEEPEADAAAALEFTVRARRSGAVEALACDTKASRGGSFTTFHLVLAASADCSTPVLVVTGTMPRARFNGVFP